MCIRDRLLGAPRPRRVVGRPRHDEDSRRSKPVRPRRLDAALAGGPHGSVAPQRRPLGPLAR
eukprot:9140445-Pyramimonas_sp.AAC.1